MKKYFLAFSFTLVHCCYASHAKQSEFKDIHLPSITIQSIHENIKLNSITCRHLIEVYIERIKKYNLSSKQVAPINAFTELNPSMLSQADELDRVFKKTGELVGSLHCVPIVIKDNIDSVDMTTTSGSYALLGTQPNKNAFIVEKLIRAGAIIIGKGGMDEFAWGLYGISSRSGRIGNVYDTNKNPGGSSGGSAAAVSASFALLSVGTDNSGSVRIPAAFHGLVGLRPSKGLISQRGIFPMGNLDGTAGPIAKNVQELAIMLDVIAKIDVQDPKTHKQLRPKTYKKYLNKNGLNSKRIGIVRKVGTYDLYKAMPKEVQRQIQNTIKKMENSGSTLLPVNIPNFNNDRNNNQAGEIEDVNDYLMSFPATRKNFTDICQSDRTRNFGNINECLIFIKTMATKKSKSYKRALAIFNNNQNLVNRLMDKYQLDGLLLPLARSGIASYDATTINTWQAPIASNADLPSITFNIGYLKRMPVGIEMVGRLFHEGTLIEMAYAYEQIDKKLIEPSMPEANLSLLKLSISEINGLLTLLGANSYQSVLKKRKKTQTVSAVLTPNVFREITAKTLNVYIG